MDTADMVIVGGGIAGASLAYFLAQEGASNVILLEQEATPGFHTSGRSAAISREWNPDPIIQILKTLSHDFFRHVPDDFSDVPIFQRVGVLDVTAPEDITLIDEAVAAGVRKTSARVSLCSRKHTSAVVCSMLTAAILPPMNCSQAT